VDNSHLVKLGKKQSVAASVPESIVCLSCRTDAKTGLPGCSTNTASICFGPLLEFMGGQDSGIWDIGKILSEKLSTDGHVSNADQITCCRFCLMGVVVEIYILSVSTF